MKSFQRKKELLLAFVVLCVAIGAGALLLWHDPRSLLYFGDSVSHIVRARQVIDSQTPGLFNIGTVWLPLPHLLLIPFAMVDSLFSSGIAGAMIGIPFLIGTVLLLFAIVRMLTGSFTIALFVALLFGLNPNLVYIALTPMNEISLIFFITLGGYALVRWHTLHQPYWIAFAAVAVLCATLCRYEAWLLAPFISILALKESITLWNRRQSSAALMLGLIAGISWLGIFFWLSWNYVYYNNALKFAEWTYSVGTSAVRSEFRENPMDLVRIIIDAYIWIFGPTMVTAGLLIFFSIRRLWARKDQFLLLVYFSLPAVFIQASLLIGFVQIDQWWWNWRFVLSSGLFLSVATAVGLQELFQKVRSRYLRSFVLITLCAVPIAQLTIPAVGVAVYNDAFKSYTAQSHAATILGKEMHIRYQSGSIAMLTGYGIGQRIILSSGLPVKSFNVRYFPLDSTVILTDRYVILGKDRNAETAEFSLYWEENRRSLLTTYTVCIEDSFFIVLIKNTQ
ncbi:MAG: hypothetical protein WCW35_01745 [Bacteroidota bacterium]